MANSNGAQINIKALIEFNKSLYEYNAKLNECFSEMERSIKRLGNDWKDDKYTEFNNEFSVHVNKLKPLAEEMKRWKEHSEKVWIPFIQEYLKLRAGQ